jgi:hypothetical protein
VVVVVDACFVGSFSNNWSFFRLSKPTTMTGGINIRGDIMSKVLNIFEHKPVLD